MGNLAKEFVKVGIVGLGARGYSLSALIAKMKDVKILYVCDLYQDRVDRAADMVFKSKNYRPLTTLDYNDILKNNEVDAVLVLSSWESHSKIAVESMDAGKYVAIEVGGAYDVEECYAIVEAHERTQIPCMMLENCCYGKYELMVKNMVDLGVFGEIVHCSGGYHHDLREEIAFGKENRHYRLKNYMERNCENYPTHELGPIAKILKINKGNLMENLFSVSSKARGMDNYIKQNKNVDKTLLNAEFKQGDIVTTVISCKNGESIVLTLDTTLPRFYSRGFTVRGTKAMYQEDCNILFIDKKHKSFDFVSRPLWNNARKYLRKYSHPIWKAFERDGVKGGHGGMDYLVLRAFIEAVKAHTDTPIDTYDTVSWMSITALSEQSIKTCQRVDIPDFTKGKFDKQTKCLGKYSLD